MVDDSSKRSGVEHGDTVPVGNALPVSRVSSVPPRSSDSILTAFRAKTDFSELKQIDSAWDEAVSDAIDDGWDDVAADDHSAVRNSGLELKIQSALNTSQPADVARLPRVDEARLNGSRSSESAPLNDVCPNPASDDVESPEPTPGELTPSPMVVCEASCASNPSKSSSISIAENEDFVWRGSSLECGIGVWRSHPRDEEECTGEIAQSANIDGAAAGHVEYHAPRPPPSSVTPPKFEASVCVATDFDPKASTQPRIPRSSIPASPMLLGLDRMLIWGMLLGGLFVAIIVVIVNQVALTRLRPAPGGLDAARPLQSAPRPGETPSVSLDTRHHAAAVPSETLPTRGSAEAGSLAGLSPAREPPAPKSRKAPRANDKANSAPTPPAAATGFKFDQPLLGPDRSFQRLAEPKP